MAIRQPRDGRNAVPGPDHRLLPAVPGDRDLEAEVVDGVIVDDDETALVPRPLGTVRAVVTSPHAKAAARHLAYTGLGVKVAAHRAWESRSAARYDRWLRSAEAAGDHDRLLAIEQRLAAFRRDRHQRRMEWVAVPGTVAKTVPWVAAASFIVLGLLGVLLAVARHTITAVIDPFVTMAAIIAWLVAFTSAAWAPFLAAAAVFTLVMLWRAGRRHAHATSTGWLAAPKDDGEAGLVVTSDTIVLALQHLKGTELQRAFRDGWQPTFHLLPIKDGRGYAAVFSLPLGVTPQMLADQRAVFARNLHRAEVEVWPSDAERGGLGPVGTAALWVADRGVLSRPAPEYPLLHEGTADVFEGVPAGVSPRGDVIVLPVVSNNFVVGGQMGQGKSNACRVVMLGAALDPLAELWVHVLAFNGDFDAYAPRLARYVKGAEDEHIEAAVASLDALYAEVSRREQRLAELGAKKVTRGLAQQHPDLRPRLALFSECHELFSHREYGELAADLAVKTMRRARKTAIWLGFDTQDARKDAIPPKIVSLVSVNGCFYVKTWRANDGFLGDGSFAAGIRATELRPGRDIGTSLITGVSDAQFELLKWYFVEVDDDTGYDAAAEVIARATAQAAPGVVSAAAMPEPEQPRDLLADLAQVTGHERVRLADLPARLRELAPGHGAYRALTGKQLGDLLAGLGVRVTNAGNVPRLDPADLRQALAGPGELGAPGPPAGPV
jgi:S-DNA-T family DNA segregation ATPase FtsK/SpoIIIE